MFDSFNIYGLPTILFFDTKGNELTQARVTGFMDADTFSAHINKTVNGKAAQ